MGVSPPLQDRRHRHPPPLIDLESGLQHPHSSPPQQQQQQQHPPPPHLHHPIPQQPPPQQGRAGGGQDGDDGDDISVSGIFSHLMETNPELRDFVGALEKYIKFLVVLFFKLAFDHGTGEEAISFRPTL